MEKRPRVHIITGSFPPNAGHGHDHNYVRLALLNKLNDVGAGDVSVSPDYAGLEQYLRNKKLLITYTAGPVPDEAQTKALQTWLEEGGRWLSLHGSAGGKAEKQRPGEKLRRLALLPFHQVMGAQFLNHPPHKKFDIKVETGGGASPGLLQGVPGSFTTTDELYIMKLLGDPKNYKLLLTTQLTDKAAMRNEFGFYYDEHPALEGANGTTMVLGYEMKVGSGRGGVVYIGLGHAHPEGQPGQPYVDISANPTGKPKGPPGHVETPHIGGFHPTWENPAFTQLMSNALKWGIDETGQSKL